MPIYDYVCPNCGHRVEVLHGVHDGTARDCAQCGTTMRKAITAPAIVFKGTGWAKMERRSAQSPKSGSSSDSGTSTTAAKTDSTGSPSSTAGGGSEGGAGSGGGETKPVSGGSNPAD